MSAASVDFASDIPDPQQSPNPIQPDPRTATVPKRKPGRPARASDPWDAILGPPRPLALVGEFLRLHTFYVPGGAIRFDALYEEFLNWLPPTSRVGWAKKRFSAGLPPECPSGRPPKLSQFHVANVAAHPPDANTPAVAPLVLLPDSDYKLVHADGYRPPRKPPGRPPTFEERMARYAWGASSRRLLLPKGANAV